MQLTGAYAFQGICSFVRPWGSRYVQDHAAGGRVAGG